MFSLSKSPWKVTSTPTDVAPTGTNCPPQVAWDVSDLSGASLQIRHLHTITHEVLSHRCAWPTPGQGRSTGSTVSLPHLESSDICFQAVFTKLGQEQPQRLPGGSLLGLRGVSASIKWGANECFRSLHMRSSCGVWCAVKVKEMLRLSPLWTLPSNLTLKNNMPLTSYWCSQRVTHVWQKPSRDRLKTAEQNKSIA